MAVWSLILFMAVITFSVRYVFFAQVIRYQMGPKVKQLLRYSSFSILTALWTPIIFQYEPTAGFSYAGMDYLVAAATAVLLTLLRINTLAIVLVSVSLFFVLRFVF